MAITQKKLDEMHVKAQVYAESLTRAQQEAFLASRHPSNLPSQPTRPVDTFPQEENQEQPEPGGE